MPRGSTECALWSQRNWAHVLGPSMHPEAAPHPKRVNPGPAALGGVLGPPLEGGARGFPPRPGPQKGRPRRGWGTVVAWHECSR